MFLKEILRIQDVKTKFLKSPYDLLKEIVQAYVIRMPFHGITTFGKHRPVDRKSISITWESVTSPNFRGSGGGCLHSNIFLKLQLESIGFRVTQLQGSFGRTGVPLAHNLNLVEIPDRSGPSRRYLVDVGSGLCLHEPVPLDQLPYEGKAGGFTFRFEWVERDKSLRRTHVEGDPVLGKKSADFVNPNDYTISLRPSSFTEAKVKFEACLQDYNVTMAHKALYLFRYLDISEADFEALTIFKTDVIRITKDTTTVLERYDSYLEMESVLRQHFWMINPDDVKAAIDIYSLPFEEACQLPSIHAGNQ